jgi:hypothetical protein
MRVEYDDDDVLINDLITSARIHIESLTGVSFSNKVLKSNFDIDGNLPPVWIVDLPYSPLICIDELKIKDGFGSYTILVKNEDYEVIGGKLWLYTSGNYTATYQAGYSNLPNDIRNDFLTLISWSYENRGKKFQGDAKAGLMKEYPNWDGLNYNQYKKVVI